MVLLILWFPSLVLFVFFVILGFCSWGCAALRLGFLLLAFLFRVLIFCVSGFLYSDALTSGFTCNSCLLGFVVAWWGLVSLV